MRKYDVVHFFWAYIRIFDIFYFKLFLKIRIINNFIGSDLYRILTEGGLRKKIELNLCSLISDNVVTGGIMKKELNKIGINSKQVDFINSEIKKREFTYPVDKKAIVYLPSISKDFYNFPFLLKLAVDFPEVIFFWFPYKREIDEKLPENVTTFEYVEHDKIFSFFEECRVFIRFPKHDGLPNTLIEALSLGRWAIWSNGLTGVERVENFEELVKTFSTLIEKDEPNYEGEEFVLKNYNLDKIKSGFIELYRKIA